LCACVAYAGNTYNELVRFAAAVFPYFCNTTPACVLVYKVARHALQLFVLLLLLLLCYLA
jgi:hypothetical protein